MSLNFDQLRAANTARLPEFKNSLGESAHSKADGSDWNPAAWFEAVFGEMGEIAECRVLYERGEIDKEMYTRTVTREIADVQTYLDIFAKRSLDDIEFSSNQGVHRSRSTKLMHFVMLLGKYADSSKKFRRGDIEKEQFQDINKKIYDVAQLLLLAIFCTPVDTPDEKVISAHETGVDLGTATSTKFNEVSLRVGSQVFLQLTP